MNPLEVKILIAEDEKIIALDIKQTLKKNGYNSISIVDNALDVIQQMEIAKPDLVIMDIILNSKLDGIDAAHIISVKYDVPVIYLSANKDEATMKRALDTHAFAYITKPFDEKKLNDAIRSALISQDMKHKVN